eukprot:NODE_3220_length_1021_cov_23.762346_g2961_i0.p1 GENE.NODE_3220_length_1021_cov_23.762346_g2961_i0~~NODE_3220_length_1021_cov_23.762346_g2961_i0.p1  ORF type:complete len:240 (-),score=30.65 NODE_3220_length_1021_cov_23.762346_g2961_i0:129-848(-)
MGKRALMNRASKSTKMFRSSNGAPKPIPRVDSGQSYNPHPVPHQKLVKKVVKKLSQIQQNDRTLTRRLTAPQRVHEIKTNERTDQGWSDDEDERPKKHFIKQKSKPNSTRELAARKERRAKAIAMRKRDKRRIINDQLERIDEIKRDINRKARQRKNWRAIQKGRASKQAQRRLMGKSPEAVLSPKHVKQNFRSTNFASSGSNPLLDRYSTFKTRKMLAPSSRQTKHLLPKRSWTVFGN